jgi:hypothetical protein
VPAVAAAFDALRFGRENTLDLRAHLPTGSEAAHRAEQFLRERQMAKASEVLVITGRGKGSVDGIAVVRPAILALLAKLRRHGVVSAWQDHTAGSFAVQPAPIRALLESPRRHGQPPPPAIEDPGGFDGMDAKTRHALRRLSERSLQMLGAPATDAFIHDEMQRQFSRLAASIPTGPGRDARLRHAVVTALDELDDAE